MAIGCDRAHKDSLSGSSESEDGEGGTNKSAKRGAKGNKGNSKEKDGKKKINKNALNRQSTKFQRQGTKKNMDADRDRNGSPNNSNGKGGSTQKTRKQNDDSCVSSENSDFVDTIEANKKGGGNSKDKKKGSRKNVSPMRAKIYASPR